MNEKTSTDIFDVGIPETLRDILKREPYQLNPSPGILSFKAHSRESRIINPC